MALKKRVVLLLCFNDGVLFRTKQFRPDYRYTSALVGNRNADEVVVLDVTPEGQGERRNFYEALQRYAAQCYSPITVGGEIRTVEEVGMLMRECGADKVVIGNDALIADVSLPNNIAHKYGRQALVTAINVKRINGFHGFIPEAAGEMLVNSIDRDGSLLGYDLELVRHMAGGGYEIPLMVAGGCGGWRHMGEAFDAGADAACTSVIHHFTEGSLAGCKTWLVEHGYPVRPAA